MDKDKFTIIPQSTKLKEGTVVTTPEEVDKWNNIKLKSKVFMFIVFIISIITIAILFIPYIKWIYPSFEIDEWALRLLILGMLAQPYLILKIITQYLFSK